MLNSSHSHEKRTAFAVMTPTRLSDFFSSRLHDITAYFDKNAFPIFLIGCLCAASSEGGYFLRDWEGEKTITLEIGSNLLEESAVHLGDYVRVFGILRARLSEEGVYPAFEVIGVSPYQEEEDETGPQISEARDTALLSVLRDYQPHHYPFPEKTALNLLLVCLEISVAQREHFIHALGGAWHNRHMRILSFSLKEMKDWKEALLQSKEDIFVLLTGEEGCNALEEAEYLFPLAGVKAHRIVILERAPYADATDGKGALAAYMMDRHFFSSHEAGEYLRQESGKIWQKNEEERARKEEIDALRESLARLTIQPHSSFGRLRFMVVGILLGGLLFVLGDFIVNLLNNAG